MIVKCIDNTLQRGNLTEGRHYEVIREDRDLYYLSGFDKGFTKTRFEVVTANEGERADHDLLPHR